MLSALQPVALIDRKAPTTHVEFDDPITTESLSYVGIIPTTEELQVLVNFRVPDGPLGRRRSAPPMPVQSHIAFGQNPDLSVRRFPRLLDSAIVAVSVAVAVAGFVLGAVMQGI